MNCERRVNMSPRREIDRERPFSSKESTKQKRDRNEGVDGGERLEGGEKHSADCVTSVNKK